MVFPDSPQVADAFLLTGSRHGVYEDHPFIAPLEQFVRDAFEQAVPMLGICFGHQIIAQALGGQVEKASAGWGLGRQVYHMTPLGDRALCAWHQDQVVTPPDGARIIAANGFCPYAGLIYPGERTLTVQAHPEFSTPVAAEFLDLRKNDPAYPPDRMAAALASLGEPFDIDPVVDYMATFLERAVEDAQKDRPVMKHG